MQRPASRKAGRDTDAEQNAHTAQEGPQQPASGRPPGGRRRSHPPDEQRNARADRGRPRHAHADRAGRRRRGRAAMDRGARRNALRTPDLVGRRHRLAGDRRRQSDRHLLHAHNRHRRHHLPLLDPRPERSRRRQPMADRKLSHRHRARGVGGRDVYADEHARVRANANADRNRVDVRTYHSDADRAGHRCRHPPDLASGARRGPLRTPDVVGQRPRLAADRRRQPDRHNLHAHHRHRRQDLPLHNPRPERRRRHQPMADRRLSQRNRARGDRCLHSHGYRHRDNDRPGHAESRVDRALQRNRRRQLDKQRQLADQPAALRLARRHHRRKRTRDPPASFRQRAARTDSEPERARVPGGAVP